jgi:hypothetical protein
MYVYTVDTQAILEKIFGWEEVQAIPNFCSPNKSWGIGKMRRIWRGVFIFELVSLLGCTVKPNFQYISNQYRLSFQYKNKIWLLGAANIL